MSVNINRKGLFVPVHSWFAASAALMVVMTLWGRERAWKAVFRTSMAKFMLMAVGCMGTIKAWGRWLLWLV